MVLDHQRLVNFLSTVETQLDRPVTLVAAGGTALVLLDVKPSTRDVDFTGPQPSIQAFEAVLDRTPHGFKVDTWDSGYVFTTGLPEDYLDRSRSPEAAARLERIDLRALHPVDVVVTKVGRFNERDREDIRRTVEAFDLEAEDVRARAEAVEIVVHEEVFAHNLEVAVERMKTQSFGEER